MVIEPQQHRWGHQPREELMDLGGERVGEWSRRYYFQPHTNMTIPLPDGMRAHMSHGDVSTAKKLLGVWSTIDGSECAMKRKFVPQHVKSNLTYFQLHAGSWENPPQQECNNHSHWQEPWSCWSECQPIHLMGPSRTSSWPYNVSARIRRRSQDSCQQALYNLPMDAEEFTMWQLDQRQQEVYPSKNQKCNLNPLWLWILLSDH